MSSHQMNTIEEFCENLLILNKGKTILQGNLKEIKKGYGRNRLLVKCDEDIKHLIKECNMEIESENAEEINLMVKSQEEVNRLLKRITDENISLVKFELREPSLHEIFIEKVGGQ